MQIPLHLIQPNLTLITAGCLSTRVLTNVRVFTGVFIKSMLFTRVSFRTKNKAFFEFGNPLKQNSSELVVLDMRFAFRHIYCIYCLLSSECKHPHYNRFIDEYFNIGIWQDNLFI